MYLLIEYLLLQCYLSRPIHNGIILFKRMFYFLFYPNRMAYMLPGSSQFSRLADIHCKLYLHLFHCHKLQKSLENHKI